MDKSQYQNIGLHLYQELLNNSRRQSQPDFTQSALYRFRKWLRYESQYRYWKRDTTFKNRVGLATSIVISCLFQLLLGFGVRLTHFLITAMGVVGALTTINWKYASDTGLELSGRLLGDFGNALYYTSITLVGFGDIKPMTSWGKLLIGMDALVGFVMFATLASMIYRKISP